MCKKYQFYILAFLFFCGCHSGVNDNIETIIAAQKNVYVDKGKANRAGNIQTKPSDVAEGPIVTIIKQKL